MPPLRIMLRVLILLVCAASPCTSGGTVRVCTSYDFKNVVAEACNIYKRSMRLPADPSPFDDPEYPSREVSTESPEPFYRFLAGSGRGTRGGELVPAAYPARRPYDRIYERRRAYERRLPVFFRTKRSAHDDNAIEKVMHKCCYEGCPPSWFVSLCY